VTQNLVATASVGLASSGVAADERAALPWTDVVAPSAPVAAGVRALPFAGEIGVWALFAVLLGTVEGSAVGLLVKTLFRTAASPATLDTLVAMLVGAANVAHIAGLGWARLARTRDPSKLLVQLQVLCATCLFLVAASPHSAAGLGMLVAGALGARLVWSGMMTLRTSVWRVLYSRSARASLGGTVVAIHYLIVAATSAGVGAMTARHPEGVRWLHLAVAVLGMAGAVLYSVVERRAIEARESKRMAIGRPRGGPSSDACRAPLSPARAPAEGATDSDAPPAAGGLWSLRSCREILRSDGDFRRYLASFFVLDSGVMMAVAPLVLFVHERSGMPALHQTLLVTTVPTLLVPLSMPLFARRIARLHVAHFRAFQSWFSVGAVGMFALGAAAGLPLCLWAGAVLLGVGYAGGSISWHLGIHDFSTPEKAPDYMALNVALTGVRGLVAPALGVGIHRAFEAAFPGHGALGLLVSLAVTAAGALGFVALSRRPSIPAHVRR
jgi:MFS family permease